MLPSIIFNLVDSRGNQYRQNCGTCISFLATRFNQQELDYSNLNIVAVSTLTYQQNPLSPDNARFTGAYISNDRSEIVCTYNNEHPPEDFQVGIRLSLGDTVDDVQAPGFGIQAYYTSFEDVISYQGDQFLTVPQWNSQHLYSLFV